MLMKLYYATKGYKTYFFSAIAIIYGIYYREPQAILTGLIGLGIANATH
jgi:hypothetical protein